MANIGWCFPSTGGGIEAGINDAGIVTFDGAPLASLAREVLQNSVDARDNDTIPVHVSFEIRDIDSMAFGGTQLLEHVTSCAQEWLHDTKASRTFKTATELLDGRALPMLGIVDSNTTGLTGEAWRGLVKMTGASFKSSEAAGGSFGVGKAAPFTLSPLRTVFYWSRFRARSRFVEKLQGKAVLVSHKHDFGHGAEMTQAIGFYGLPQGCEALEGSRIPDLFRPNPHENAPGTAIWVIGFRPEQDGEAWQKAIARSVVTNFFLAIARRDLEVLLEPGEGDADSDWQIDAASLEHQFNKLAKGSDDEGIRRSRLYWRLTATDPVAAWEDADLGTATLWIGTEDDFPNEGDGLPSRVALIRKTGMLITDDQSRQRFRGLRDYVAVCAFDDDEGNELLRRMENPAHNQFEYSRLESESERTRGRRALDRLRDWIRKQLVEHASPRVGDVNDDVDELAEFLYDDRPGAFQGASPGDGERSFGGASAVARRPPRQRVKVASPLVVDEGEEEGDGDDAGSSGGRAEGTGGGGNGTSHGAGDGEGTGGTGSRGGSSGGARMVELEDVRIVVDPTDSTRARIWFTALETARATLSVEEVGDSSAIPRDDVAIRRIGDDGELVEDVDLIAGQRYSFGLSGREGVDVAWQVRGNSADGKKK